MKYLSPNTKLEGILIGFSMGIGAALLYFKFIRPNHCARMKGRRRMSSSAASDFGVEDCQCPPDCVVKELDGDIMCDCTAAGGPPNVGCNLGTFPMT